MRLKIDISTNVKSFLTALENKLNDLSVVFEDIGEELLSEFEAAWKSERDPLLRKWADLKESSLKRKTGGYQILRDTGRLQNSFTVQTDKSGVTIGTNVEYAKYHQFGTKKMPKRMLLPDRSYDAMEELIINRIKEFLK